jgi:hypothetical protein
VRDWASPNGGSTQLDPEDGQVITGIGTIGPYLLVFKERKAFIITDTNTGAYRNISDNIGCASHRSIVETDNGTFFLTEDQGIMITDGTSFDSISLPVRPVLNSIPGSALNTAAAAFKDSRYYISVTTGTVNDIILEYDLLTETWWAHKIYYDAAAGETGGINDWALLDPSTTAVLYGASAHTSIFKIFEMFKSGSFQDRTSDNYLCYWNGPWHTFSQPHIRKIVTQIRADALGAFTLLTQRSFSSSSVTEQENIWDVAEESSTFGGSGTYGGTGVYGEAASVTERRYYTPGTARAWSIRFESQNNQDLEIYAYTMGIDFRTD